MPYFGEWCFQKRPFCCAHYFRAATTDTKLEVVSPATNEDQFKWKFIGTKDNFIMVSKAGKYVYAMDAENTGTARFQLGTVAASAETFYFDLCGDDAEIVRVDDTNRYGMNDRSINTPTGVGIYNNNDGGNKVFWLTSCMMIDLTAAFGDGKEPSKDWLDKHITAFSDTPTVQYVDNLGELFKGIADAIRAKSGQTGEIMACDFADRIRAL